jgi:hypothetical protein
MSRLNSLFKIIFHLNNFILIFFYLYPGSILGYIMHGNLDHQPQITKDFLIVSSNHFYAFALLSFFGILAHFKDKKINFWIKYLFLLSIIIELFHILIPQRNFQFIDLFGNLFGVLVVVILFKIGRKYELIEKKNK